MTKKEWFLIGGDYEDGGYFYDLYSNGYLTYDKLPKESIKQFLNQVQKINHERGFKEGEIHKVKAIKNLLDLC